MQVIALLRGVMPTGKNRIPRMADLVEILENAGFQRVQTYIQSGNILLETELPQAETARRIHDAIFEKLGAEFSVILKTKAQLAAAVRENPFDDTYDASRIHLVFTNDAVDCAKAAQLQATVFPGEEFVAGNACFYLYLPRSAEKKTLNSNYLERRLDIVATMRKLSVVQRLYEMASERE